jgi:hypothetical protein
MQTRFTKTLALVVLAAFAAALPFTAFAQDGTSSAINGLIADTSGKPVTGATVAIVHEPTGASYTVTTRNNGRYNLTGLRVGGPYTITVTAPTYQAGTRSDIGLLLQQSSEQNFALAAESVVTLEKFVVTGTNDSIMAGDKVGSGTYVGSSQLDALPNFSRSVADVARMDPRISVEIDNVGETTISAGGKNNRFNSVQVDGIAANDEFGLNDSGVPAHSNPISFDTIDQITVSNTPYDVSQAGFTGASINAVTKSGTNQFHGSLYTYYRDRDYFGDNPLYSADPTRDPLNVYKEKTWGATLGGPIVPNRLFFFLSYEKVEKAEVLPTSTFQPDPTAVAAVAAALKALTPSYDPGVETPPSNFNSEDEKILAKIDWTINRQHRLSYRYNNTLGIKPQIRNFGFRSGGFEQRSLSEHWYTEDRESDNHIAKLYSNWTSDFNTQLSFSRSTYSTIFDIGQAYPQVEIRGIADSRTGQPSGALRIGTEQFRHNNLLDTKTNQTSFSGSYNWKNHTFSAGVDADFKELYNVFQRDALTTWTFASLADFQASAAGATGRAVNFLWDYALPGKEVAAAWDYYSVGLFLQDRWQVTPRFVINAGVRLDTPVVDTPPEENTYFAPVFGIKNNETIDGQAVFQPRIGFNYSFDEDRKTQLRGGIGLFYGSSPDVWLSNNYTNTGVNRRIQNITTAALTPAFRGNYSTTVTPPADAVPPLSMNVDALDPNFQNPTDWKANLALEHRLPWLGGVIASAELDMTWVDQAIAYRELANLPSVVLPDGRRRISGKLSPQFNNVFLLTNTDQGKSENFTFSLERPMKNKWSARVAVTLGRSNDVNSGRSAQASSNWDRNPVYDYNEVTLSTSDFEVRYRFLGVFSREFEFVKNAKTTVSLVYDGQAGRPFSYVFDNNVNNSPDSRDNDLFYVPLDSDPIVRYTSTADEIAIRDYINARPELAKFKGQVAPRNKFRNASIHRWDLKLAQELRFWKGHKIQATLDFINIGNMINDEWGQIYRSDFPGIISFVDVANAATAATDGFYRYTAKTIGNSNSSPQLRDTRGESRWSVLAGLKYSF